MSSALLTTARALAANRESERAIAMYERAAELLAEFGPVAKTQQALGEWADILATMGRYEAAYELTRRALQANAPAGSSEPHFAAGTVVDAEAAPVP
jgi:tetratricopeptide (TPR) repeat protein